MTNLKTTLFALFAGLAFIQAPVQGQARYLDPVFKTVKTTRNITYGAAVNRYSKKIETLLLDLYEPNGDSSKARATVVMVHGGGFVAGDKGVSMYRKFGNDFAKRGFVAVSLNYRMAPSYKVRKLPESAWDAQEDTKAAVRFLRRYASKYRIDSKRIAAIGSSAGGFAVVMASYYAKEGQSGNAGFSSKIQAVCDLWGGTFDLNEMQAGETPLIIIHGTNDPIVSYKDQALKLEARCKAVGIPVELHAIQGAGHSPWYKYDDILKWTLDWYYFHMKLTQKGGLIAKGGFSSPGVLNLTSTAPAGMGGLLLVSSKQGRTNLGDLGTLSLDMAYGFPAFAFAFPSTPKTAKKKFSIPVPPGLKGYTLYLQCFVFSKAPYSLTNFVETRF